MPFTGKATFTAGVDLPELVEDVADLIGLVSPWETPLLDHLGDPQRTAASTMHEWIEDALLPNTDTINQGSFSPDAQNATSITVTAGSRFRVGDQVRPGDLREILFVTAVAGNVLTVTRRYGNTPTGTLANGMKLTILGNAAIEGDDRPAVQFTNRTRRRNYTQIFTSSVEVSGSMQAARKIGGGAGAADELDYQKQERLREMIRDLENCVINGVAAAANPQGSSTIRRTMNGLIPAISTNQFTPGSGGFPSGGGSGNALNEVLVNTAMRLIWEQASSRIDTIVCGGVQKRRINEFLAATRLFRPDDTRYQNRISAYESDFGLCRVVMSRWVPADTLLLLDSSRVNVLPLAGRSFHFKPLASTGDSTTGMLVGEYTLEFLNENAHGLIRGLATT
jgi:hypothetical protein